MPKLTIYIPDELLKEVDKFRLDKWKGVVKRSALIQIALREYIEREEDT